MDKLDSERRREQLAQAALELIAAHGLNRLSVARVARRVGLVPSAIYRHFAGKDDLLDAVIALIGERLHRNVEQAQEKGPDALGRLHHLLLAHVRVIRENRGILRLVFADELHRGRPESKARIHDMIGSYLKRVAAIVSQGQQDGSIRQDLDPATAAVMFLGLIQPAAILWHLSNGEFDVTRQVQKSWPVFRSAIAAR